MLIGWHWIWIACAALIGSLLLAALCRSLRQAGRTALEAQAASRNGAGSRISQIADNTDAYANAMMLPIVALDLLLALALVMWVSSIRSSTTHTWVDVALGLALALLSIWLFPGVIAQSIAEHAAVRFVAAWAWLVCTIHALMMPVRPINAFVNEVVRRLAGDIDTSPQEAREAELLSALDEVEGQFDESERDMIEAVVDLRSKTVEQIMTPRTEINAIEFTDNLDEVQSLVIGHGHSRIPVFQENLDHIVGILYAKDLLHWMAKIEGSPEKAFRLKPILREALFVPETKTVRQLLTELTSKKVHLAIVVDEYGGVSGLVTIEDIVEEIFGEIWDEYEQADQAEAPKADIDEAASIARVDARMEIDALNDALRPLDIELPEGEEYDTLGGFVVTMLGRIPKAGESFTHEQIRLTILKAEPTRVLGVRIQPIEAATQRVG